MDEPDQAKNSESVVQVKLKKLRLQQVQKIDEFLSSIGAYGEIRLIVQNGELRYINKLESHSVLAKTSKGHADP